MSPLTTLCLQLLIPLLTGPVLAIYLKGAMYRILIDLCGTAERADFWWRISSVLLIGLPLILVLAFGHEITLDDFAAQVEAGRIIRQSFALTVFGILIAVAYLARQIRKFVPQPCQAGEGTCAS